MGGKISTAPPLLTALRKLQGSGKRTRIYSELTILERLFSLIRKRGSMSAAAREIGVTPAFISSVVAGTRAPGPKIAEFFGFDRYVVYIKRIPTDFTDDPAGAVENLPPMEMGDLEDVPTETV